MGVSERTDYRAWAKAFFYAGSQTLLVSHSEVFSEGAKRLSTEIFAAQDENPSIDTSEALRRWMMALIEDRDEPWISHPMFLVPFVGIGE